MNCHEFIGEIIEGMKDHVHVVLEKGSDNWTDEEYRFLETWDRLFQGHEMMEGLKEIRDEASVILEREKMFRAQHRQYKGLTLAQIIKDISDRL